MLHKSLLAHAEELTCHKMNISKLASIHEEIGIYRKHLKLQQGEASPYYQLSANLLTLSRLASNDESDDSDIKTWLEKFPIISELYERIVSHVSNLQNEQQSNSQTITVN
jgi:hypothetical protein